MAQLQRIGDDHYRCDIVVSNRLGLHARPASMVVELANNSECDVSISKGDERANARSILQLLSLAADVGTPLRLEARGADALPVLETLVQLLAGEDADAL